MLAVPYSAERSYLPMNSTTRSLHAEARAGRTFDGLKNDEMAALLGFLSTPPTSKSTLWTSRKWIPKLVIPPRYTRSFGGWQRAHVTVPSPVFSIPKSQTAELTLPLHGHHANQTQGSHTCNHNERKPGLEAQTSRRLTWTRRTWQWLCTCTMPCTWVRADLHAFMHAYTCQNACWASRKVVHSAYLSYTTFVCVFKSTFECSAKREGSNVLHIRLTTNADTVIHVLDFNTVIHCYTLFRL